MSRLSTRIVSIVAAIAVGGGLFVPARALALEAHQRANVQLASAAPTIEGDAGWQGATHVATGWDFTHGRVATEPADVALAADGKALYVRFTVKQRAAITATQSVDGVGEDTDDLVTVRLWPDGVTGLAYDFRANPRGTHYQASSENANYAPAWTSRAHAVDGGYVVTMRIPFSALRSSGHPVWQAQFERDIRATGERDEWAHAPGQSSSDQVTYAGLIEGFPATIGAARAKPRVGVYALAQGGPAGLGGDTSRLGADLAIPITNTASFVATIHPDFSNVEADQQTIAPTTFTRYYNEVRPFFAQGARFYDYSDCYGCPNWQELYTPAIPTPRSGYQLEGTAGPFTFGALDAIGAGRIDDAESIDWKDAAKTIGINYTRVASDQTALTDLVNFASFDYNSQHGVVGYVEGATEQGTNVLDARQAQRWDGGIAYQTKDDFDAFTMRRVGPQWNPVDGYTSVNDVAGYSAQLNHTINFDGPLKNVQLSLFRDFYAGSDGFGNNLQDFNGGVEFNFAHQFDVGVQDGSAFYRVSGDPVLHPDNQQGFRFDYRLNAPEQSTLMMNAGAFGTGWLIAVDRLAGLRIARRVTLALEAYSTNWIGSTIDEQWLERATATFSIDHETSATIGLRRIVGTAPPFPGQALPLYTNTTNLSFSLARRRPHDDIFLVYGDPNAPLTQNTFILKYVHYFGADRGT